MSNFYEVLGVAKDTPQDEIKKAYKRLAKEWHPDRNPSPEATEKFKQINEAYEVLGDPEKRSHYDHFGSSKHQQQAFNDIFERFSQFFQGGKAAYGTRIKTSITLEEAFRGVEKKVQVQSQKKCQPCSGTGATKWDVCKDCGGRGMKTTGRSSSITLQSTCMTCSGSGKTWSERCNSCTGTGIAKGEPKEIVVQIPPGVENGTQVRIAEGIDGTDVYVIVDIQKCDTLVREGVDLFGKVEVSYSTLVLGGEAEIERFGEKIKVKIAPQTAVGTRMRLKQQGMPYLQNPNMFGNLFITINLKMMKEMSDEYKDLVRRLAELER